jgi:hypothetical protein
MGASRLSGEMPKREIRTQRRLRNTWPEFGTSQNLMCQSIRLTKTDSVFPRQAFGVIFAPHQCVDEARFALWVGRITYIILPPKFVLVSDGVNLICRNFQKAVDFVSAPAFAKQFHDFCFRNLWMRGQGHSHLPHRNRVSPNVQPARNFGLPDSGQGHAPDSSFFRCREVAAFHDNFLLFPGTLIED